MDIIGVCLNRLTTNLKGIKNMTYIFGSCPRCGDEDTTFNVIGCNDISYINTFKRWQDIEIFTSPEERCSTYELSAICKKCSKTTILIVSEPFDYEKFEPIIREIPTKIKGSISDLFEINGHVLSRHNTMYPPPIHIPKDIKFLFEEGAACLSNECWNAAGTMFRACLDLTAKNKLAEKYHKKTLFEKIDCLFEKKVLSEKLRELATCIKDDGNDGAHDGTLTKGKAMDLLDFIVLFLESVYTNPNKLENAIKRHADRKIKEAEDAKRAEKQYDI